MRKLFILSLIVLLCLSFDLLGQPSAPEDFNFVFMTDIHLEPDKGAPEGFKMAIDSANRLNADFILTGGDLIADALGATHDRAEQLYSLYNEAIKETGIPVYNTIGNHELFGIYQQSGVDSTHPDYNTGMYQRYFGNTYYSFDHKGWHFIILNSNEDAGNRYIGHISEEQISWLKSDLEKIDKKTPIILCTHIPFITTYNQLRYGALAQNDEGLVVTNSRDILIMLHEYNLKLVLQGHLHIIEYINLQDRIHFLVGGAVSAKWWRGPNEGMEEGFMYIKLRGEDVEWEYIDYGWNALAE